MTVAGQTEAGAVRLGVCHRLEIPGHEWTRPDTRQILAERNLTGLYRLARRYGHSQTVIGNAVGKSQPQVSEIMGATKPHHAVNIEVLHRHADAFGMPLSARMLLLGISQDEGEGRNLDVGDDVNRREMLRL